MGLLLVYIASHGRWAVFGAAFLSFAALYAIFAGGGWWLSRSLLPAWRIGAVVDSRPLRGGQIASQIRRSLVSIAIFGCYGVLVVEMFRARLVNVAWEASGVRTALDAVILFIWN